MLNKNEKKILTISGIMVLLISFFSIGFALGRLKTGSEVAFNGGNPGTPTFNWASDLFSSESSKPEEDVDMELYWKVWNIMKEDYVEDGKYDEKEMVYGSIKGLVRSYDDPATLFLDPEETNEFEDRSAGKYFEGIGAELGYKNGFIRVVAPLKGSPAEKAGLQRNDVIIKIDGEELDPEANIYDVVADIRGEAGTEVVLTVLRDGESSMRDVSIKRGKITVPSITLKKPSEYSSELTDYNGKVKVIDIGRFTDENKYAWQLHWDTIVDEVKRDRTDKVIIDLRNNPGGFFDSAVYAAEEFLPKGTLISQQKDQDGNITNFKATRNGRLQDVEVVVLINDGSASASEIFSGALKHHKRADIVGVETYGKGTAQIVYPLPNDASLHLTVMKWLLPDGSWINPDNPVKPDIKVEFGDKDFEEGRDPQMKRALEELIKL